MQLNEQQKQELTRLKSYFPFRIVYGALRGDEFISGAVTTKKQPNKLARAGWLVWTC